MRQYAKAARAVGESEDQPLSRDRSGETIAPLQPAYPALGSTGHGPVTLQRDFEKSAGKP